MNNLLSKAKLENKLEIFLWDIIWKLCWIFLKLKILKKLLWHWNVLVVIDLFFTTADRQRKCIFHCQWDFPWYNLALIYLSNWLQISHTPPPWNTDTNASLELRCVWSLINVIDIAMVYWAGSECRIAKNESAQYPPDVRGDGAWC